MNEAKDDFEKERDKILGQLPQSIRDSFGILGFCPSGHGSSNSDGDDDDDDDEDNSGNDHPRTTQQDADNDIVPVLIMNPYHVPPKPVRDVYWFDYFSKARRSKTLGQLAYLVYYYGANDPDDCYSFVEQADFIDYETGVARGYSVVPAAITAKLTAGIHLTDDEAMRVRAIDELMEDVHKAQSERKRGIDFQERHEMAAATTTTAKTTASKKMAPAAKKKAAPPAAAPPAKRQKKK
jgi:hypothetical protein